MGLRQRSEDSGDALLDQILVHVGRKYQHPGRLEKFRVDSLNPAGCLEQACTWTLAFEQLELGKDAQPLQQQ